MKKILNNEDYVKSETGAIVLTNNAKYLEHRKRVNKRVQDQEELVQLKTDVSDLKEMVNKLIKGK